MVSEIDDVDLDVYIIYYINYGEKKLSRILQRGLSLIENGVVV